MANLALVPVVLIPSPVDSDSSGEKVISGLAQDECSRKSWSMLCDGGANQRPLCGSPRCQSRFPSLGPPFGMEHTVESEGNNLESLTISISYYKKKPRYCVIWNLPPNEWFFSDSNRSKREGCFAASIGSTANKSSLRTRGLLQVPHHCISSQKYATTAMFCLWNSCYGGHNQSHSRGPCCGAGKVCN